LQATTNGRQFSGIKIKNSLNRATPSVAAPGDTNPSDATKLVWRHCMSNGSLG